MKAQRQISLEILRILCMLFIVAGHIGDRSGIESFGSFATIAPHAVNCFVLISGYFLINSRFKAERILRTAFETIFYTFTITIILLLCGKANLMDVAKSIMPFAPTKFSYWFVNKYLAVILLSPFINRVCCSLSKKQYQILIGSLLLIGSTLFLIFPFGELFGNGFSLLWMTTVYITGGYLKLNTPKFGYWGLSILILLAAFNLCNIYLNGIVQLHYNSLITYSLAIATFMWFKTQEVSSSGIIARITMFIAPHVFAAYLIHEQGLIRIYIVDILNKFNGYIPTMLYLYLFSVLVIVLSAIIDKGRIIIFKYLGVDSLINRISSRLNKLYEE